MHQHARNLGCVVRLSRAGQLEEDATTPKFEGMLGVDREARLERGVTYLYARNFGHAARLIQRQTRGTEQHTNTPEIQGVLHA